MRNAQRLRLAVIGKSGQVARAIASIAPEQDIDVTFLSRPDLDLEMPDTITRALESANPAAIVNAAAYTAVDKAESEPERAEMVNAIAPGAIGAAAAKLGVPVVHLSTDYVFSGHDQGPRRETDATGPASVYGATKLRGEASLATAWANHAILRTAWVHAPWGTNFVRTMLRLGHSRKEIGVVDDQHGSPTSATEIARAAVQVARVLTAGSDTSSRGVFHLTCNGWTSWAGFAAEIFRISGQLGGPIAQVKRISTADYPTPARRPANSRLDCSKLNETFGISLPLWSDVVKHSVSGHLIDLEKKGWQ